MATVDLAKLKNIDNKTKNIVFAYIWQCQLLFDKNISYYNIPDLITYICLLYYGKQYIFMNGMNILSREWNKWDDIEYDSDAGGYHPDHPEGTHRHKGKIWMVHRSSPARCKIMIKRDDGSLVVYPLINVNLKLIDNGKPIISYEEAHAYCQV